MPRNLPHWTECTPVGLATTSPGNIPIALLDAVLGFFVGATVFGAVMNIIAFAVQETIGLGCIALVAALTALIFGLNSYIDWYDNRRLACIKHDQCAIGTVVDQPKHYDDGDTALNLLLAPFSPGGHLDGLRDVIDAKRQQGAPYPLPQDLNTFSKLQQFLKGLSRDKLVNIYQTLVYTRFFPTPDPNKDFQKRYFIKTPEVDDEHAGTFGNLPDDSFKPDGATNPLFRFPWDEDKSEQIGFEHLYVYIHTEIEGHQFTAWLENVRDGLIAGTIATAVACAICTFLAAGNPVLCGLIGGAAAALIAFLVWLFKHLTNNPGSKKADVPQVDVQDPDFSKSSSSASQGDVVVVFGDWVMDMEHDKYFEIHPVKAWYHVCSGPSPTAATPPVTSEVSCVFDQTTLTAKDYEDICTRITTAEVGQPLSIMVMSMTAGLTMIGGIKSDKPVPH